LLCRLGELRLRKTFNPIVWDEQLIGVCAKELDFVVPEHPSDPLVPSRMPPLGCQHQDGGVLGLVGRCAIALFIPPLRLILTAGCRQLLFQVLRPHRLIPGGCLRSDAGAMLADEQESNAASAEQVEDEADCCCRPSGLPGLPPADQEKLGAAEEQEKHSGPGAADSRAEGDGERRQ
jgi:hypothetical protein